MIFSLEMSRNEITMRLLSAEARVPLQNMRNGTDARGGLDPAGAHDGRGLRGPAVHRRLPEHVADGDPGEVPAAQAAARPQARRHRLPAADASGKRVESRQQEVSEFSRALKLLAKELEVPVIAICQLNRGPEQRTDKKPQMSDLRESGSIEQDADMVILLHREDMYEKESPRAGEADFIVAKHRNGPTGHDHRRLPGALLALRRHGNLTTDSHAFVARPAGPCAHR